MIPKQRKNRRSNNNLISIIVETYKDFAQNTSIHGLKYTVQNGISIYEKIFWLIMVLLGLMGAGYMTVLFWDRYTSNPTRTSIQTAFAPSTSVEFPAVTICNINRIMINKVDEFTKKLNFPPQYKDIVNSAFPQLLAFTNPLAISYNLTELSILQEILENNDFYDMKLIMKKISQNCKEMILTCYWNFRKRNCSDLFKESLTPDGLCCSFNYDYKQEKPPIHYPYNGFHNGLAVTLNPMFQPIQYSSLHSEGLKVTLHSSSDYPGVGSISKIISGGRQNYLQVIATKIICSNAIRQLSIEQRNCLYPEERSLDFFPNYVDTNCWIECDALNYYNLCECIPFYYPFSNKPVCNLTKIPCLVEARHNISKFMNDCNCLSQCEDNFYEVLSTTATLEKDVPVANPEF